MRNRSAAVLEPSQASTSNPAGDFAATHVRGPALYSGRVSIDSIGDITTSPLSDLPDRAFVSVTGTVMRVRLYGREDADQPRHAALVLDSGTGATVVVSVDQRRYEQEWGHLIEGHLTRVSGSVRRPTSNGPIVVDLKHAWAVTR